jgi:uncharacterized protein (DUF1684 family)
MDNRALLGFRQEKDEFFATSHESPLGHGDQRKFAGLRYFDPNPELVFRLAVEPVDGAEIRVETSDGQERTYTREGKVSFEIDGTKLSLTLYSTGHPGFFLPFRDSTSATETYGAGRYLDIDPHDDGTVTLDFNLAYNPYCVYSDAYSCPLPPVENWLQVPVRAGELNYDR